MTQDPYLEALRAYEHDVKDAYEVIRRARERLWATLGSVRVDRDERIAQAFLQHADPTEPNGAEFAVTPQHILDAALDGDAIQQPGQEDAAASLEQPAPPSQDAAEASGEAGEVREDDSPQTAPPAPAGFICSCGRTFANSHALAVHRGRSGHVERGALAEKKKPWRCPTCDATFQSVEELGEHRRQAGHRLPVGRAADGVHFAIPSGGGRY